MCELLVETHSVERASVDFGDEVAWEEKRLAVRLASLVHVPHQQSHCYALHCRQLTLRHHARILAK